MPQVSRFTRLPLPVQEELERRFIENGFSQYIAIADDLRRQGYRISKSALHRFVQKNLKPTVLRLREERLRLGDDRLRGLPVKAVKQNRGRR